MKSATNNKPAEVYSSGTLSFYSQVWTQEIVLGAANAVKLRNLSGAVMRSNLVQSFEGAVIDY